MKPRLVNAAIENKVPTDSARTTKEVHRWLVLDGKKILRVTCPKVHGQDVKGGTLDSIRKQLQLDREQFRDFVECRMSQSEYVAHIRSKHSLR